MRGKGWFTLLVGRSTVGRQGVRGKMAKGSTSLGLLFIVTNLSLSMYVVCA